MSDVVAEGLAKEPIGSGEVLLAMTEQNTSSVFKGTPGRLGYERRLAETRLSRHKHDLAPLAAGHPLTGVCDRHQFGLSTHHTHLGQLGQRPLEWDGSSPIGSSDWLPEHLDGLDRVG